MSRRLPAFLVLAVAHVLAVPAGDCVASDWMFRRSYFSHDIPPELAANYPVPVSYSAYRPAIVSPYPGFAVNGARRYNRVLIQSGNSLDYTILRSDNFRIQP